MISTLWERVFNDREKAEINLAVLYASQFNHGTSGHLGYRIVAKFAALLDALNVRNEDGSEFDVDAIKKLLEDRFGEK